MTAPDQLQRYGIAACAHSHGETVVIKARDTLTGELAVLELEPAEARHFNYELAGAYLAAERIQQEELRAAA